MIWARRGILAVVMLLGLAGATYGLSPEETIVPLDQYRSEKPRALAAAHALQLRQIYDNIYHCLPWLEIAKHGLGFRKPRQVQADEFYLSIWVWVEQEITSDFASLPPARRASAMFSRYGVDLLRRLSVYPELAAEARLTGYSVVLSWLKPDGPPTSGNQAVAETLAVFVDKAAVQGFFARTITPAQFADRAVVSSFDGKTELGRLALEIWEDSFTATFKLKDHAPDPGRGC